MTNKQCTGKCGQSYPATTEYFYQRKPGVLHSECKQCMNERSKSRRRGRPQTYIPVKNKKRPGRKPTLSPPIMVNGKPVKKRCTKCGDSKPLNMFPKTKHTSDGYGSWCKKCVNLHNRQRRNATKWLAYWRQKGSVYFTQLINDKLSTEQDLQQIKNELSDKWSVSKQVCEQIFKELYNGNS